MAGTDVRLAHHEILADESALLVTARSNVGPIDFAVADLSGAIDLTLAGGVPRFDVAAAAVLHVQVGSLTSGNKVYDAELMRRVDARRFPTATVELEGVPESDGDDAVRVGGALTFHGVRRLVTGTISVSRLDGRIVIDGRQTFDIRNFDVATPSLLMLKVYPDVTVSLHVEAEERPSDQ